MGLINKVKTANRTGEKRARNVLGGGNVGERLRATDTVIRSCGARIGAVSRKSTTTRGHTSTLVTALGVGDVSSDFWFERLKDGQWSLTLGADSSRGIAVDWSVQFSSVSDPVNGPTMSITTTQALTRDGALVQGGAHDLLRNTVADQVGGTERVDITAMTEISQAGLANPTRPLCDEPPATFTDDFQVSSPLSMDDVRVRTRLFQGRRSEPEPDTWVFELGVVGQPGATATMRLRDNGDARILDGSVRFVASNSLIVDSVAHVKAAGFADNVLGTMKLWEAEAQLSRPGAIGGQSNG